MKTYISRIVTGILFTAFFSASAESISETRSALENSAIDAIDSLIHHINNARNTLDAQKAGQSDIDAVCDRVHKFLAYSDCKQNLVKEYTIVESTQAFIQALTAYVADASNTQAHIALTTSKDVAIIQLNKLKTKIREINGSTGNGSYVGVAAMACVCAIVIACSKAA